MSRTGRSVEASVTEITASESCYITCDENGPCSVELRSPRSVSFIAVSYNVSISSSLAKLEGGIEHRGSVCDSHPADPDQGSNHQTNGKFEPIFFRVPAVGKLEERNLAQLLTSKFSHTKQL